MNLKCPSKKPTLFFGFKPLTKMVHIFLGHLKVIGLILIVFAFGHLNDIKCFNCSNNHKLKCLLLDIFYAVAMINFMIFGNALEFLIKP